MGFFKKKQPNIMQKAEPANPALMAELALNTITDGVVIIDRMNAIRFINPAAVIMTGCGVGSNALGLDFTLVIKLETRNGAPVTEQQNSLLNAVRTGQPFESREFVLVTIQGEKRVPVGIKLTPVSNSDGEKIITFRDITKELAEEGAQMEFISTASHEMRTPVAAIEGYLSLALNPQTATIDERAKQYLDQAHSASQHLGRLFRDLLDATKFDDGHARINLMPTEVTSVVRQIAGAHAAKFQEKDILFTFGSSRAGFSEQKVEQLIYAMIDVDFLQEIINNLLENAFKYTPEHGSVWMNVLGDGDRVLINVTDTGMGIAQDDLQHIFQKFYRADNSQTRTIGGTGLGLYLVKQRVEAMGGRVWAESAFGEGSTFYVSLPRLSPEDYEKYRLAQANNATNMIQ